MEEFEHTDTEARGKQGADVETSCPSGKPELKQMFPGLQFVLVFLRFSREFARDVMPSDGPGVHWEHGVLATGSQGKSLDFHIEQTRCKS